MPGHSIDEPVAKERCIQALKAASTRTAAAVYAGIGRATFYRWLAEDEAFETAVQEAEAHWQVQCPAVILNASPKNWLAAAWLLERHPQTKMDWKRIDQHDMSSVPSNRLLEMLSLVEEGAESPGDTAARAEAESHPLPE